MASKYTPIWEALKKDGKIKLAIPPSIQKRVIKAVINLKDQDTVRKLEMNTKLKKERIHYMCDAGMVQMQLVAYDNLNGLTTGDL